MKTQFEFARPHARRDSGLPSCESIPWGKAERNINTHALANYLG